MDNDKSGSEICDQHVRAVDELSDDILEMLGGSCIAYEGPYLGVVLGRVVAAWLSCFENPELMLPRFVELVRENLAAGEGVIQPGGRVH
jgi:hypothetical protein